jgi:hypothetical protein
LFLTSFSCLFFVFCFSLLFRIWASFSFLVLSNCLHHLNDIEAFFVFEREMARRRVTALIGKESNLPRLIHFALKGKHVATNEIKVT